MGRKTFESIGRPLRGRLNIILTRDDAWQAAGVSVATSMEQAIDIAEGQARIDGADSVMVIGGAEVYRQALPFTSRVFSRASMARSTAMLFLILAKSRYGGN
jgi:dihydrofolate reductase